MAVDVGLVRLSADLHSAEQLFGDVSITCRSHQSRHPVLVRHDVVRDLSGFDLSGPPYVTRHSKRALPVRILLGTERRDACVGPGVKMDAVVRAVHHDRVVSNSQIIDFLQQLTDVPVVFHHPVGVFVLSRNPAILFLHMSSEVHTCAIPPTKERLLCLVLAIDKVDSRGHGFIVDCLHSLFC